ncbi:MAG TPA: hypothetical protein VF844_08765 [Ktedonobacteraceae bacterium]
MALLEELKPGVLLKGLVPGNLVTVIDVKRQGSICVELTYKDASGHFDSVLLFHGSVQINPIMMAKDAGQVMEEVVKHLVGKTIKSPVN